MGIDVDAILCYGFSFEEGFEFPWDREDSIEEWWRKVNKYVNPHWCPFDKHGEYMPGVNSKDPRVDRYFGHAHLWMKEHPLPVELVWHCSGDQPMHILAVSGTIRRAYWGQPERVDNLTVELHSIQSLIDFCHKYEIKTTTEPAWWLCSKFSQ